MYALTIGYQQFLFASIGQASKAMELFEAAKRVESTWNDTKKESLFYTTPIDTLTVSKFTKPLLADYETAKRVCEVDKQAQERESAEKVEDVPRETTN